LRNLSALLPQDQKGVATFLLGEKFAHLVLTRQGVLYLARRIEYNRGYKMDESDSRNGDHIDAATLGLELQRSLDYFESHYDQTPIGDLVIAPGGAIGEQLALRLRSETSLRISLLNLDDLTDGATKIADTLSTECLLALGAALRTEAAGL
jgi:MSHA biogenesis protein MshI